MSKAFEFADFVDEFKVDFTVYDAPNGQYVAGKWIAGGPEVPRPMSGIILPLSNDELKYEGNGVFTSKDRKIYTVTPLKRGQKIEYEGQKYTIQENKPYEAYADVYIYFAKGVDTK